VSTPLSKASTPGGGGVAGNSSAKADRQLIRPSSHIPWSVDVVSAVPKELVDKLPKAVTGATCPGWSCLGLRDGIFFVWQQRPTNLSESFVAPPKEFLKIYLTDLISTGMNGDNPMVALAPTPDGESVHLYAAHPTSGWLVLRKVSRKDLKSRMPVPRGYTTKVRIGLEKTGEDGTARAERLTALTASLDGLLAVGTSWGNLFWVTQTSVPVGLNVQKVTVKKGFFSSLFSSAGSDASASSSGGGITFLLPQSVSEFISVSQVGTAVKWKVTATATAAHHATFEPTTLGSIVSYEFLRDFENPIILQATLAADGESIHVVIRATPRHQPEESKLYWMEASFASDNNSSIPALTVVRSHWLSRFAVPERVKVLGVATVDNANAYGAFSSLDGGAVIIMVLLKDQNIIQEVDLPVTQVPGLLPNIFVKDTVTHGCTTIASSGIGIRVRFLPPQLDEESPNKRRRLPGRAHTNPAEVLNLVSHLRSAFWESYKDLDMMALHMPPSLKQAEVSALEEAVVILGAELQYKGDASSSQNPLEWHKALIKLLQEGGLYRSLSEVGRWKLLSIGQELAVFYSLLQGEAKRKRSHWEQAELSSLLSHGICDWLLRIQDREIQGGWQNGALWSKLLCLCLEAATAYREEWANSLYDVMSDRPPRNEVNLWMSHPSLQTVLVRQMEYWKREAKIATPDLKTVETVVRAALSSYDESCSDDGGKLDASETAYAKVKALAIRQLRTFNGGDDEVAFDLSIQHCYFEGLCQIAVDHEKKWDAKSYSLDSLFATLDGIDYKTKYTFSMFVLQWHTDVGLYGHVINYGRHSTSDLNQLMKKDDRLRPYRWIPAIRQSHFTEAREACIDTTNDFQHEATLGSNLWALSMAKLVAKLEPTRSGAVLERQKDIERKVGSDCSSDTYSSHPFPHVVDLLSFCALAWLVPVYTA
jgi:hypothetical protein